MKNKSGKVEKYYLLRSSSPILTTSPAPGVINKFPLVQFSERNFFVQLKFSLNHASAGPAVRSMIR